MPKLLLEIGLLDLPSRFVLSLQNSLEENVLKTLHNENLDITIIKPFATPRRIGFLANCPEKQPDREKIILGPPKTISLDADGSFTIAAEGFAKKNGIKLEDCSFYNGQKEPALRQTGEEKHGKGECLGYKINLKGESAIDVLIKAIPIALSQIESPVKMKWGNGDFEFLRPVRWITAMLDNDIIPFSWMSKESGNITYGHLIHKPAGIVVQDPSLYEDLLNKEGLVIAERAVRKDSILKGLKREARRLNGEITLNDENNKLVDSLTDSVEFPAVFSGKFPQEYLSLPAEVIDTVLREHQHFFMMHDKEKSPMPFFISVSDIPKKSKDIVTNYEAVTISRLKDALFFYEKDIKKPLIFFREDLKGIVFHNKLGTYFDKTERLKKLASFIARELNLNKGEAERSAELSKCDLATSIIGEKELTSLQGTYGGILAGISKEDEEVCRAIGDQYKQEIDAIKNPISLPLYIADRIDNLTTFFSIGIKPKASGDPFGLRRAAIEVIRLLISVKRGIDLNNIIQQSCDNTKVAEEVLNYLWERLKIYFVQIEIKTEIAMAVLGAIWELPGMITGSDPSEKVLKRRFKYDIYDAYLRAKALDVAYSENPDDYGAIGIAFKRAHNIVKGQMLYEINDNLFKEKEEKELFKEYNGVNGAITPLFDIPDYPVILKNLRSLRPYIDRFFDKVLVMCDPDGKNPDLRLLQNNRIALLHRLTLLFANVADFSLLYGTIDYGEKG